MKASSAAAKLNCLLIGDGSLLIQCGALLLAQGHHVVGVVTANDAIAEWAQENGAAVVAPGQGLADRLAGTTYDWLFSIANLSLIPTAVWQAATSGTANFHDGPLPRYAGLNTPAWAMLAGETQYGVTWQAMSDEVDAGDIHVQSIFDIDEYETSLTLNTKCLEAGIASFMELIGLIETGGHKARAQDLSQRTYHGRHDRPHAAATLDFTATTADIDRVMRAMDFGQSYVNPLGLPKIRTQRGVYFVRALEKADATTRDAPGTVCASDADGAVIATKDGAVRIKALVDAAGTSIDPATVVPTGETVTPLTGEPLIALEAFTAATAKHEAWFIRRLQVGHAPEIYGATASFEGTAPNIRAFPLPALTGWTEQRAIAAIAGYFIRSGTAAPIRLAYVNDTCATDMRALSGYVAPVLPLVVDAAADATGDVLARTAEAEIAALAARRGYPSDLILRHPNASIEPFTVAVCSATDTLRPSPAAGALMTFVLSNSHATATLEVDTSRLPIRICEALLDRMDTFFRGFAIGPRRISDLPVMSEAEELATVHRCNETTVPFDRSALIHRLIEAQAARTPEAIALVCEDRSLTYRELDRQANRVAKELVARGAGPDRLVGLYLNRSCELVIGGLAILKAGAAYVPLDPTYPADRIAHMIEDSGLTLIVSGRGLTAPMKSEGVTIVAIEDALASEDAAAPASDVGPEHLAYVIYTSGSTGQPKGVMVEHRNAVNFFAGMDARVPRSPDGQDVWLAVTSLSFDISVLELFWTLSHGFKVVVQTDTRHAPPARRRAASRTGGMDFSLFFWGNDDGVGPRKYDLLLNSARFADDRGFRAVWTPERHFHAFGGPYPNPSVTGAAVAAITKNLDIRAGSCVLPLHHPARVVEEWAVIDNLSNGRTGLAFASGWMPEDFLLRPENAPPHNKTAMLRDIETVRRLWRGEPVVFTAPDGKEISVVTQPRPVSQDLPIWVTTAGNPDTYREAARIGANVLTHLLGQSIAEVGEKIAIYRQTLAETGRDPNNYTVTLMLHTLLGEDKEQVRDMAREPMKAYLRSAVALIKQYAWAFPAFKKPASAAKPMDVDLQTLDPEELDAIIEFAFLRYFDDSGLFGTVDDAMARVEQVKAIGVDEIACLIDFGVSTAAAMTALEPLAKVVAAVNSGRDTPKTESDFSVGNLIRAHGVTHLQFTPSMAAMLLMDDDVRQALKGVRHLFIGGEALQAALVRDLRSVTGATIENMYGPTETTVWSSTMTVGDGFEGVVPLGMPIANTQLYILDHALRPVPVGQPGELFIGGEGVTRGYLKRPELTAERFLPNPFTQSGRMYRTGDLVRRNEHGAIQFIGRADHQVKVRGHRIELGEIEAHLATHPSVAEAVAVVRQDEPNDVRIVAYLRLKGPAASDDALRAHVKQKLPDYMMPAHFVTLEKFPLTPNAKVDRSRLPRPEGVRAQRKVELASEQPFVAPTGDAAQHIADAFKRVLGIERVGMNDNFFSLGGHSLLAVQMHRSLKASLAPDLSITDIYRFPTVAGLAAHLGNRGAANAQLGHAADRAAARRNALAARAGRRVS
ncbi:MAG: MupA/Atu3671 family FMN-dependent luciferase-like monooxygenase [Hyphomicrobiaceae bacterium]